MSNGITSLLFVMNGFCLLRFRLRLRLRTIYFNIPVEKNAGANCIVFAAGWNPDGWTIVVKLAGSATGVLIKV